MGQMLYYREDKEQNRKQHHAVAPVHSLRTPGIPGTWSASHSDRKAPVCRKVGGMTDSAKQPLYEKGVRCEGHGLGGYASLEGTSPGTNTS